MRTEEIPITSIILYGCVILKNRSRDTGRILASVLFVCKIYKRTGRNKFSVSVYRKKQDEECVKQNGDFYNMNVHVSKLVEMKMMEETIRSMKSNMGIETQVIEK